MGICLDRVFALDIYKGHQFTGSGCLYEAEPSTWQQIGSTAEALLAVLAQGRIIQPGVHIMLRQDNTVSDSKKFQPHHLATVRDDLTVVEGIETTTVMTSPPAANLATWPPK